MSREVETKIEVSEDGFRRLLAACRLLRRHEQLNVYYDFEDRLSEHSATLRVRYQHSTPPKMTLKIPLDTVDGRRTAIEIEEALARGIPARCMFVDRDVPSQFRRLLSDLGVPKVERLGAMRNCRTTAQLPDGPEIELDEVELPDGTIIFEIEVEHDDPAIHEQAVSGIARVVHEYSFSRLSKFQRFLHAAAHLRSVTSQPALWDSNVRSRIPEA